MEAKLNKEKTKLEPISWSYFDKYEIYNNVLLPARGDGLTMASQAVTACCKLVYKYYNDGDVYDNQYYLTGWANDISGSANWLYKYIPYTQEILIKIKDCLTEIEYEHILKELCDCIYIEDRLNALNQEPKVGDAYNEDGPFKFIDLVNDEDYEYEEEDYYEDDEEECY